MINISIRIFNFSVFTSDITAKNNADDFRKMEKNIFAFVLGSPDILPIILGRCDYAAIAALNGTNKQINKIIGNITNPQISHRKLRALIDSSQISPAEFSGLLCMKGNSAMLTLMLTSMLTYYIRKIGRIMLAVNIGDIVLPFLRGFAGKNAPIDTIITELDDDLDIMRFACYSVFAGNQYYTEFFMKKIHDAIENKSRIKRTTNAIMYGSEQTNFFIPSHDCDILEELFHRKIGRISDENYTKIAGLLSEEFAKMLLLFTETMYASVSDEYISNITGGLAMVAIRANDDREFSLKICKLALMKNTNLSLEENYLIFTDYSMTNFGKKIFRKAYENNPDFIFRGCMDEKRFDRLSAEFPDIFSKDNLIAGIKRNPRSNIFAIALRKYPEMFTRDGLILHEYRTHLCYNLPYCYDQVHPRDIAETLYTMTQSGNIQYYPMQYISTFMSPAVTELIEPELKTRFSDLANMFMENLRGNFDIPLSTWKHVDDFLKFYSVDPELSKKFRIME